MSGHNEPPSINGGHSTRARVPGPPPFSEADSSLLACNERPDFDGVDRRIHDRRIRADTGRAEPDAHQHLPPSSVVADGVVSPKTISSVVSLTSPVRSPTVAAALPAHDCQAASSPGTPPPVRRITDWIRRVRHHDNLRCNYVRASRVRAAGNARRQEVLRVVLSHGRDLFRRP